MQKVKKGFLALALMLVITLLAGYSGEVVAASAAEGGRNYTIAVVPKEAATSWFRYMREGVEEWARANPGCEVIWRGPSVMDATQQVSIVRDLIAQGVDAIAIVPIDPASLEAVCAEARESGIVVISHEGETFTNKAVNYNVEAFENADFGAFMMDSLAEQMGYEGVYTTMVGQLTNASHNQWVDGAIARQRAEYPNLQLLEEESRVEMEDSMERAYELAKELIRKYPQLKAIQGAGSYDTPGVSRAIEELGLIGKFFVISVGMPSENEAALKAGIIKNVVLWSSKDAGFAMCELASQIMEGVTVGDGIDLKVDGYRSANTTLTDGYLLRGQAFINVTAENVDDFGF